MKLEKDFHNFWVSELEPITAPKNLNILNFKVQNLPESKNTKLVPISWGIYQYGKLRQITMPNPERFDSLYKKWKEIEPLLIEWFHGNKCSNNRYIVGVRKRKNKKTQQKMWSESYFLYKAKTKYSDLEMGLNTTLKKGEHITYIDIKNFFNSIYVHSVEWAFYDSSVLHAKQKIANNSQRNEMAKKVHDFTNELCSGQTNGLPIGPNISRIISNIIAYKVDQIIKETLVLKKHTNIKINRFVDDVFIKHYGEISQSTLNLIEQRLYYYKMTFNKGKEKLNQTNGWDIINWKFEEFKFSHLAITKYVNKIVKISNDEEVNEENLYNMNKEIFRKIKESQGQSLIEDFKADNTPLLLRSYLVLDQKNDNKKLINLIKNISITIWVAILRYHKYNPAVWNSFAGLIFIISRDTRKATQNLKRRISLMSSGPVSINHADILFPFSSYLFSIDKKNSLNLLKSGYNLSPIKGKKRVLKDNDMIDNIPDSFIY